MSKNIGSESSVVETTGLSGSRISKYEFLGNKTMNELDSIIIQPSTPFHLFLDMDLKAATEYENGTSIKKLFYEHSVGITTARDRLTIRFTEEEVLSTVSRFSSISVEEARTEFSLGKDVKDWKVHLAQKDIKDTQCDPKRITRLL